MAPKSKGLGRGLDALLATSQSYAEKQTSEQETTPNVSVESELQQLPIEHLSPGKYQPRKDMATEPLEELAASIKSQGIIQPIVVRTVGEHAYEIIAGERRWRAAQIAKLDTVPCLVKSIPDDAAVAMALIENIQREDLNAMEEAQALDRLMVEFKLTHQQVAEAVGKSRTTVTNILRLNGLQTPVKTLLEHGDIDMGHARALLAVEGNLQESLAKQVAEQGLTVRETESLIRKIQSEDLDSKQSPAKPSKQIDPDVKRLMNSLSDTLGAPVNISHNSKGKGKLTIAFSDLAQLEGILAHIDIKDGA
ncbi:ParB/RepB/Spo0J family partition protein [Agaribacter flavus]|uniref:Probable chromosome-partitioning protein ParB n=1 Tax=Agaribacter flavus TaxID=1902781 RepID=A0ABV7FP00_9ALTE